ncbi:hypothetical protein [Alloactinosynnema sp. L-07]|nr:hypothetical protein [Alloactinosynnema sp. L-07]
MWSSGPDGSINRGTRSRARLYEYGAALAGAGDRRAARQAWEQVLRCSDTSGSWAWKARAQARLS